MGKKRRILLLVLLLIVFGGLVVWLTRPREPYYNGKSLSEWLDGSNSIYDTMDVKDSYSEEAVDAVHHIGTNAIPTLLLLIQAQDSPLKARLIDFFDKHGRPKHVKITSAYQKNSMAVAGFGILGADAKTAVPELIRIYEENPSTKSQDAAASALGAIGPAASNAIPPLLHGLADTNGPIRADAAWALGKIHCEPGSVVPALQKHLHDPTRYVCIAAAVALGSFGTNASSTVPDLTGMLNDQDHWMREAAGNALMQIDPEAAARAGFK